MASLSGYTVCVPCHRDFICIGLYVEIRESGCRQMCDRVRVSLRCSVCLTFSFPDHLQKVTYADSSKLSGVEVSAVAAGCGRAGAEALVFGVAESVGLAGDGLDDAVGAFGAGVGDAGVQEREDFRPPGLDRGGVPVQFEQVRVGAAGVEAVQQPGDGFPVRVGAGEREQVEQVLFAFQAARIGRRSSPAGC